MAGDFDYSTLDQAIAKHLEGGPSQFTRMFADSRVKVASRDLAAQHKAVLASRGQKRGEKEDWRFLDSRLQALRKKGVIQYVRAVGWTLTTT